LLLSFSGNPIIAYARRIACSPQTIFLYFS
jgi:hypothetical protein